MKYAIAVVLGLVVALAAHTQQRDDQELKPNREWKGYFPNKQDLTLFKETPAGGRIVNEQELVKLWKAWRPKEEPPKVNFKEELVFVYAAGGPNIIGMNFRLSDDGDLDTFFFATERGGTGFVYRIVTIPRKGVKSIKLAPLEK